MDAAQRREISEFLATHQTAGLATVDERGQPHAANVWYATDDPWRFYFISSPDSAHARHMDRTGRAALTVYHPTDQPGEIHGWQMHGLARALREPSERQRALEVYGAKYPLVLRVPMLRERVARETFYELTPTWWRWLDNRRGFGFKVESPGL